MTGPVGNVHGHTPDGRIVYPKDHTEESEGGNKILGISKPLVLGGAAALVGVGALALFARRTGGGGGVGNLTAREHASEAVRLLDQARVEWPTMPRGRLSEHLPDDSIFIDRLPTSTFKANTRKGLAHTDAFVERVLRDRPELRIEVERTYSRPHKYTLGSVLGGFISNGPLGREQGTYQKTQTVIADELSSVQGYVEQIRSVLRSNADDRGVPDIGHDYESLTSLLRSIDPAALKPPTP